MSEPIDTFQKAAQVTDALLAWFKSQEIAPFDSVFTIEFYLARMIVQNSDQGKSTEDKVRMIADNIYELIPLIKAAHR